MGSTRIIRTLLTLVLASAVASAQTPFRHLQINGTTNRIVGQSSVKIPSGMTLEFESGSVLKASSITNGTAVLTLPSSTDDILGRTTAATITGKSISLGNNTLTGTSAQLATALADELGSGTNAKAMFSLNPSFTSAVSAGGGAYYDGIASTARAFLGMDSSNNNLFRLYAAPLTTNILTVDVTTPVFTVTNGTDSNIQIAISTAGAGTKFSSIGNTFDQEVRLIQNGAIRVTLDADDDVTIYSQLNYDDFTSARVSRENSGVITKYAAANAQNTNEASATIDSDLTASLPASSIWEFEFIIWASVSGASVDWKDAIDVNADATYLRWGREVYTAGTAFLDVAQSSGAETLDAATGMSGSTTYRIRLWGYIQCSGSTTTFSYKFARNGVSGTAFREQGSLLKMHRLN